MYLKIILRESILREVGKAGSNHTSNSPRARSTILEFGNEVVHREELFGSVNLMSATRVLQNSRKEHMKPCSKKDAPAEKHKQKSV